SPSFGHGAPDDSSHALTAALAAATAALARSSSPAAAAGSALAVSLFCSTAGRGVAVGGARPSMVFLGESIAGFFGSGSGGLDGVPAATTGTPTIFGATE